MINDMGNVEYFELCETDSQVQCSCCLSCWASSSSCSHPTPLTLMSSPVTTSSRLTSQITFPHQNTTAWIPLAKTPPPTGYEPNVTDTSDEFQAIPSLFQGSNVDTIYDLGGNDAESTDAEIDDEHTRYCACITTLFARERSRSPSETNLSLQ